MTDKELIKQEIERRFDDNMKASEQCTENSKSRALFTSAAKEDYDLLAFIDSIPEEHSEDLEKEIKRYINEEVIVTSENVVISKHHEFHNFYVENLVDVARHFAEWQHGKDFDDLLQSEMKFPKEFYEKGRFDMREELIKDAVDAIFIQDYAYKKPVLYGDLKHKMNIVSGQPIKLCQVKEKQQ